MQFKKLAAITGSALLAGLSLAAPVLASTVTKLSDIKTLAGVNADGTAAFPMFVIGATAATSDVAGAIDIAVNMASNVKTSDIVTVPGATASVTGGVLLDTADTKLYLTQAVNKVKTILTATDIPGLLTSSSVEDVDGTKYDYSQYLNIGNKVIQFGQPDVSASIKDPAYLVKLGTTADASNYLAQGWVSFTKQFNASNAIGKELTLFGKTFTISSETDSTQLVLFGLAGKETVTAGESKDIVVGTGTYTVQVVGISATNAVLSVNGIQKQVTAGKTYDFGGTSVYVSDVFYYEVPNKSGSVVLSIGSDRYVFKNGAAIQKGTSGNEEDVKGTYVSLSSSPNAMSDLKVSFDGYVASPAVDYVKAGTTWTDPIFGLKVAYSGPATINSDTITIAPGASNYYTVSFVDKYGKSGTISFAYDPDPAVTGGEVLQDSTAKAIHVVEGESAALNEYVFVSAGSFPHMLKITNLENAVVQKATFKDVFSGTEYKATNSTSTTGTAVIDGQSYTVTWGSSVVGIADGTAATTYVFPTLQTKYGANVALFTTLSGKTITGTMNLPTGSWLITNMTTPYNITTAGQITYEAVVANGTTPSVTGINAIYVGTTKITKPAVVIVEEQSKDPAVKDAAAYYVLDDETTDKRLELQTPAYTNAAGDLYKDIGTSSTTVSQTATEWGTNIVIDKTSAGTATITYPDTQLYHLVAVGSNPVISVGASGTVTTDKVLPITADVVKLDSEMTSADKSAKDLVLMGGPCINTLVAELATAGSFPYACTNWPGRNFGRIQLVSNAFATGKTALVIAGTTAADTDLASLVVQAGMIGTTDAQAAGDHVEVTGTVSSPVYTVV